MNPDQYSYYKAKYAQLLEHLKNNKHANDIYTYLINKIKFDDIKHRIFHNGDRDEIIKCYFPLSALTKIRNKKHEQRKNYW
jgi:hypothetical protein